jgi:hypothetical protein
MGVDFSNHWLFLGGRGDGGIPATRALAEAALRRAMADMGLREVTSEGEADRSIVVAPAGRWLFIGDTAGTTDTADPEGFEALSRALSTLAPVVDINMSDSAILQVHLYRDGGHVDQFGNGTFPIFGFKDDAEAATYRGRPAEWADLLAPPYGVEDLRAAWDRDDVADVLLNATATVLGLRYELLRVGYTHDDEGLATKYDEYLEISGVTVGGLEELHFARA